MIRLDTEKKVYLQRELTEQRASPVTTRQADYGAVDELRTSKLEKIQPELFALPGGNRTVESQLTDLSSESENIFGTTDN